MVIDPALYIQALTLIMDLVGKIPKELMSDELRLEIANKTDAAKQLVNAKSDEEKKAALIAMGKATDESPIK